jgi:hypothetical protein
MQLCIRGGDDCAALQRRGAMQVRDHAARTFDDRNQRHDVVRLQHAVDHQVDATLCQQRKPVAVAAPALQAATPREFLVGGQRPGVLEHRRMRAVEYRVRERGIAARAQCRFGTVVAIACAAHGISEECLAREGLVHDAHDRLTFLDQSEQDSPRRHAADERARAVDRVDDPVGIALARVAVLLADDAVRRELLAESLTYQRLDAPVRFRDRVVVNAWELVVHAHRTAEVLERDRTGLQDGSEARVQIAPCVATRHAAGLGALSARKIGRVFANAFTSCADLSS